MVEVAGGRGGIGLFVIVGSQIIYEIDRHWRGGGEGGRTYSIVHPGS